MDMVLLGELGVTLLTFPKNDCITVQLLFDPSTVLAGTLVVWQVGRRVAASLCCPEAIQTDVDSRGERIAAPFTVPPDAMGKSRLDTAIDRRAGCCAWASVSSLGRRTVETRFCFQWALLLMLFIE